MRPIDADAIKLEKGFFENINNVPKFFEWLGKQPTITIPEWIPVSERLPLVGEEVNVSVCDETGDTRYNYTSHGWLTTNKEYWIVDNEINNYVIAWMPLPMPWRGEKNEQ